MNTYVRTETKVSNTQKKKESVVVHEDQLSVSNGKPARVSKVGPSQSKYMLDCLVNYI